MKYNFIAVVAFLSLLSSCEKTELKEGESIVNAFYSNIETKNYKLLDKLMSFLFYQGTPYKQFIEMLDRKNNEFGKINRRSLGKYKMIESINATDTIHLGYVVEYQNVHTKESFTLIKEKENFKILKYYVSQEDN
ncbi:hypothetical protein FY557_19820 [Chryseobacterium sp. SN22]|nr:hypothetical protein FY557_19820 [Chryseobacterium sp. SN22]